ncbi:MAG: Myb-like DNA-binding domain-containing protein [Flammeovirgaceae bacterium]
MIATDSNVWSKDDIDLLKEMVEQGVKWKEIAAKIGKPLKKVKGKYKNLT